MQFRWAYLLALALALLLISPAAAQSAGLTIDNQGCSLDRSRLEAAAQPLVERGARVVIVCTDDAGGDIARYLDGRLSSLGIAESSNVGDLPPNAIIYFVSLDPRASGIIAGQGWASLTEGIVEDLRLNSLNPQLQAGNFTVAFANAMNDTANIIGSRGTGGGTTVVETEGIANWLWGCLAVGVIGLLAAVFLPGVMRRRRAQQAAQAAFVQARDRFEAARKASGAAIADVGRLMEDAKLKQRFDAASYSEADVQQLAQQQREAEQLFARAQHDFDEAEERIQLLRQPATEDYQAAAASYENVRATIDRVREILQQLDARRAELDRINREASGGLDSLKKA